MQEQESQGCYAIKELRQLIAQSPDQLTIIDVRSQEEFDEKHIPGAISIPLAELESRSNELSKQSMIITVCSKGGGRSSQAAELLNKLQFVNTKFLCEGTFGWYYL